MPPVVLLAEHEPEVAELARRYLARADLTVTVATNAEDTIAALGEHSAAAAVLDLTMPGLDARRIRRLLRPRAPHRPPAAAAQPRTRRDTAPGVSPTAPVYLLGSGMRPRDVRVSADVCLYRPFSPRLLVARVLAAVAPASRGTPFARGSPFAHGSPIAHGTPFALGTPIADGTPFAHGTPSADGTPFAARHPVCRRHPTGSGHTIHSCGSIGPFRPGGPHQPFGPRRPGATHRHFTSTSHFSCLVRADPGRSAYSGGIRPAVRPRRPGRPRADPGPAAGGAELPGPGQLGPGGGRAHRPAPREAACARRHPYGARRRLHRRRAAGWPPGIAPAG